MTDRKPLDPDVVKKLPEGKTAWDPLVVGFGVRAFKTGASFFLNYRLDGRDRRYTIGSFPTWSVGAARARAKELRKEVDQGRDPAGEKRERRDAPDIGELIDRYVVEHLPKKAADSHPDELRMLKEIGDRLGRHTKVADVHGGDISKMHADIGNSPSRKGGKRKVRANRILSLCSKMFSLSLVPRAGENEPWRDQAMGNPCKGIERNPEYGRERFYSEAELAAIGDALAAYPLQDRADVARLVMVTGCRPVEALRATWEQFDLDGFWVKPGSGTKQRKTHRLPLSPPALELIERLRRERAGGEPKVFPGVDALASVWNFVRRRCGFQVNADRLYDLRHSFASVGAAGGLSLPIIGKLLGHSAPATTARYSHLADDPLREATNKVGAVIAGAGRPRAKVVPL